MSELFPPVLGVWADKFLERNSSIDSLEDLSLEDYTADVFLQPVNELELLGVAYRGYMFGTTRSNSYTAVYDDDTMRVSIETDNVGAVSVIVSVDTADGAIEGEFMLDDYNVDNHDHVNIEAIIKLYRNHPELNEDMDKLWLVLVILGVLRFRDGCLGYQYNGSYNIIKLVDV